SAAGLLAALADQSRASLPESLFQKTLKCMTECLSGAKAASGVQSLAEGVLTNMLVEKIKKTALAVVLIAGMAGLGFLGAPNTPAAPPAPANATAAWDRDRLQGTWSLVKVGDREATREEQQAPLGELTFRGDRLIDTFNSGGVREAPFRLNEKPSPKHLDWNLPPTRQNPDGFRPARIYKGDGDTLALCGKSAETPQGQRPAPLHSA